MSNPNQAIQIMEKELYVAARRGNVVFLEADISQTAEYLCKKTHEDNNIIHIAIQHEQHYFVEASLRRLFSFNRELLWGRNSKGNTPLHVAAEVGNLSIVSLLLKYLEEAGDEKRWRVKNSKGNTPLHVALIHQNPEIARSLLDKDPDLAYIVNDSKEAPLHLAIKHHFEYSKDASVIAKVKKPINEGGADLATKSIVGDDMLHIIEFLAENWTYVTSCLDASGSTPLHIAASLSKPYNLRVIRTILDHSPLSAEVCDASGNSILHLMISRMLDYQECKDLLEIPEVHDLRNYQDQQGNTPLHIAVKKLDINMVRVLLESSSKLSIKNMEGISAASLIEQHSLIEMLRKRKMTREECEAADKANITFLRERMSRLGMDFLLSRDSEGRNVLHRLMHIKNESRIMEDDFVDFIQQILGSSSALVSQIDLRGDTPIHVLVRNGPDTSIYVASGNHDNIQQNNDAFVCLPLRKSKFLLVLLELCNQCILQKQEEASLKGVRYEKPWLIQNAEGNTALHEALLANNNILATRLLRHDQMSATLVNIRKDTPLHLLARSYFDIHRFEKEIIELMVRANVEVACMPDQDGLTPLLRAFQAGNFSTATILCTLSSEAARIPDAKGYTFWQLLINHPSDYYFFHLLQDVGLRDLLNLKDKNGNTPLHLAIEGNRFDLVKVFFETWELERNPSSKGKWPVVQLRELQNKAGKTPGDLIGESSCLPPDVSSAEWLLDLLKIENKAGKTPSDLIADAPNLPHFIEEVIQRDTRLMGLRSSWGIPKSELQSYMNSMNVIAALLTTITFTAAFTVPGGLNQDNGIPMFIGNAAFQVFMISDVIAMCLSMMVLLCLLWIMATSDKRKAIMIQDLSVSLLLASFIATLLTFMTGVYATISPIKPWIAIVTLVVCSSMMLLVHKVIVIRLLLPSYKAIVIFRRMLWRSAAGIWKNLCRKIYIRRVRRRFARHRTFFYV